MSEENEIWFKERVESNIIRKLKIISSYNQKLYKEMIKCLEPNLKKELKEK